jgi:two-component system KDP operon response regulator KdpE
MTSAGTAILVIDDEPHMRRFLRVSLANAGYDVLEAEDGAQGLSAAASKNPDLVLLDLGLPDQDGLSVTARLREWSKSPIIVISARGNEEDKVTALDQGADDYLTKPFGVGELLARIRVALRHVATEGAGTPEFVLGELKVDFSRRQVFVKNTEVHLTPIEYKLLALLVKSAGRVITHRQLLREVWGPNSVEHTHYLRVYMGQLRHKLEENPSRPLYIVTEPGIGYRIRQ